jgi:hypothetical protein
LDTPQNPPAVTLPVTLLPLMLMEPLRLPVALRLVLMSSRDVVPAGYVSRATPVRVVDVNSASTPYRSSRLR